MSSPLGTVVRLLLACLVVGLVLKFLNMDAVGLLRWVGNTIANLGDVFGDLFHWAVGPILVGAVVVIPIWLIALLMRRARGG
jgi:hypothetical protein